MAETERSEANYRALLDLARLLRASKIVAGKQELNLVGYLIRMAELEVEDLIGAVPKQRRQEDHPRPVTIEKSRKAAS